MPLRVQVINVLALTRGELPVWPHRVSLTSTHVWHHAALRQRSLPPLLRSIDMSAAQKSLPLFFVPPGIRRPRAPVRRLLRSGLVFCFFHWSSCSHKPQYHDLPKGHITMTHRSAAAPLGMKAPCDLCREIWCVFCSMDDGEK